MKKQKSHLLLLIVLMIHSSAWAVSCEVEFRAKREVNESHWFGKVERPEFRSGIVSGEGENQRDCERDALSEIKEEGWEITYQRTQLLEP